MKAIFVTLCLLATPLSSLACPGGHLKSLSIDGRIVAELNMADSSIRVLDANSKITGISTTNSRAYKSRELCGQTMECENPQLLDIDVNEDPQAVIVVAIREANASSSKFFKLTNFYRTRSMNSCGQIVEALE